MDQLERETISNHLSMLQLKYDVETIYSLVTSQLDGVTAFGLTPYYTLTTASILEYFKLDEAEEYKNSDSLKVKDVRLKLKVFEDGYSKSKRMMLNIDYLQNEVFKNKLKFKITRNWNIHYNIGIYADENNHVIGNTQYNYYILQDNRLLKKNPEEVIKAYNSTPEKFDLKEQTGKDAFEYGRKCGEILGYAHREFEDFDNSISISINTPSKKHYYADYNTNKKSTLFPEGEDGKAIRLYLLHTLSTLNFPLYVLKKYEKDDYGWFLKAYYISYYYTVHKLRDLQQYLIQNKLLTPEINSYFTELDIDNAKHLNGTFRNYIMHSNLTDKDGNFLIDPKYLDKNIPLFGLVETCFDGMTYYELKNAILSEATKISDILSSWLNIESLKFKPLD